MFIFWKLCLYGLAGWVIATLALRFEGQRILHADSWPQVLLLFAISFPLMALLVRLLCRHLRLHYEQWPAAAIAILLPTLLLDPFSTVFFPAVFPNMAPALAAVFGAWMLWCCAGGLVGAVLHRPKLA
jgi:hypothetical protein